MRFKTTLTLLVLLLLVGAAWFLAGKGEGPAPAGGTGPSPWAGGFDPREADYLKILDMDRGGFTEVRLRREGPGRPWKMVFPTRDRADQVQVEEVLRALAGNPWILVGSWDSLDSKTRSQMGLSDQEGNPSGRGFLEIRRGEEKREAWIGETDVDGTRVFVLAAGKVWKTPLNLWTALDHNPTEFRDHKVFTIPLFKVKTVEIQRKFRGKGKPGESLLFRRSRRGWWMLREGGLESRADPVAVKRFLALLAGMKIEAFVGDLPGDLSRVGLDPPFYRILWEGDGRKEVLSLGKLGGGGEGVLARVTGRPFLLAVDAGPALFSFLEGRGVKTPGQGVDFRGLRPVPLSPVTITWVDIHSARGGGFRLERATQGEFDLVRPWKRAARDNRVQAWLKELTDLKASSSYDQEDTKPAETGLDSPRWIVEIGREGFLEPYKVLVGRRKGKGVYLGVPGEKVVYFVPARALDKVLVQPLELVSLVVFRLRAGRAEIVVFEGRGRRLRWDLDTQTGEYHDGKGAPAGEAFLDLVDTLTDLSGIKAVSDQPARVEDSEEALVFRFHAFPLDPASKEPGRIVGRLTLLKEGNLVLAASDQSDPLVFQVPARVWDTLVKALPWLEGKGGKGKRP